ncbi:hypothetical protein HF285_08330 [Acidithiobacillus ferrooxidans F221]|uniref:hypothetical protein n=1 Tax=Acidithiobacillus ferrooxidans TaxID=920 RepID=UPI001C06CA21|nr:hypothetical protein [Acidithiobacillus ferrooxidans]MBU2808262.1 hypothetical protein [Acidithiobacillus ferrooxidans F221]
MMGMKEAVDWLAYAISRQWPTTIVGDYDVVSRPTAFLQSVIEALTGVDRRQWVESSH